MITLIFLAGGTGSRMGAPIPKQYIPLKNKPIALYSLETFLQVPEITQVVVVCEPEYQHFFPSSVLFAKPGVRRQDSVYSGLQKSTQEMIFIHDSARPFFEAKYIAPLIAAVQQTGAAALATPVTSTLKLCKPTHLVEKTLDRSLIWDMQSPQALWRSLMIEAFEFVHKHNLSITDDLSMVEAMGLPTQIVPSSPRNFKITTPFDLAVAECVTN